MYTASQELVSVIIPFLNGSHWLAEAIESVQQQTYPYWELIVLDDGSDAVHSLTAQALCNRYPDKIRYMEHPNHINRGVSISRNEASKLARGKYLAFLDADDVWFPNKLADQLAQFDHHPQVQVVFGAFTNWYSWQHPTTADYVSQIGVPAGYYPPGTLNKLLYPFVAATTPAPSGIMITKEAFDRIGRFEAAFSGIYELYEDQAFLAKVYQQLHVYISGQSHLLYRQREGSMSSAAANRNRYHTVRTFYCNWLLNYLQNGCTPDEVFRRMVLQMRQESMAELPVLQPAVKVA